MLLPTIRTLFIAALFLCAAPNAFAQSISAGGLKGDDGGAAESSCRSEALTLNQRLLTVEQFINSVVTCNQNGQVYNSATNTCITPLLSPDHTFTNSDTGDTIALEQLDGTMGSPVVIGGAKGADVQCEPVPTGVCTAPWGAVIADGASVTAYQTATVPFGSTCNSQTRTCSGGVLSGSYPNQNCIVGDPGSCPLPWGGTINHGQTITAYQSASVAFGSTCTSQSRSCNNGALSGSYANQACVVEDPTSCPLPWGGTINHGQTVTAYQTASVTSPATCTSEVRTCSNGTLDGTYANQSCTVNEPTYVWVYTGMYSTQQVMPESVYDSACGDMEWSACKGCANFPFQGCTPGASCTPGGLPCLTNERKCKGFAVAWDRYACLPSGSGGGLPFTPRGGGL